MLGEEVIESFGIRIEPEEFLGLVVRIGEAVEGVVYEIMAEDVELVGFADLVDLYVWHNYDGDEIIR